MSHAFRGRALLVLVAASAVLASPLAAGRPASRAVQVPENASRLFQYDAAQPLDVRAVLREQRDGAAVYDVTYASPKGGRVSAYLVTPSGAGPFAGLLFGHWGGGNRTEFLPEAILYARAGAVSLLPDYPWTRPAPWRRALKYSSDPANDFEAYVQAVVDLRRGIDLLLARKDVDPTRLGYVGHSYGAQWGAILAAVDRRPKAVVLIGGVPDLDAIYLESDDPDTVALRTSDPARVRKLLDVMAPLAAVRYVGAAAPAPLLFQFARYEQNFPESAMRRYYAAASEPKSLQWYPTGHDLNDPQTLLDRAAWLRSHLAIGGVSFSPAKEARDGSPGRADAQAPAPQANITFDEGATTTGWLPIELWRDRYVYLRGMVNGHETPILLDSGAGMTVVDAGFARELGLELGREVTAVGGRTKAHFASGVTTGLGQARLRPLQVVVIDLGDVRRGSGAGCPSSWARTSSLERSWTSTTRGNVLPFTNSVTTGMTDPVTCSPCSA